MADEVDRAQEFIELEASWRKPDLTLEAEATGFCLYCEEELTPPSINGIARRWCDADCATDYKRFGGRG